MAPQTLHSTLQRMALYFESGQYVLQSYAVGIVDFEIPAADFGDDLTADIF